MDSKIRPGLNVFEYGIGGSTLYFIAQRCNVVSVEHDALWYDRLSRLIGSESSWTGLLCPPRTLRVPEGVTDYGSSFPGYKNCCFEEYVRTIELYPDGYFDIIMIDGRSREAAMRVAVRKLSVNGCLILDNAERARYASAVQYLQDSGYVSKVFCGAGPYVNYEFWSTLFMFKT